MPPFAFAGRRRRRPLQLGADFHHTRPALSSSSGIAPRDSSLRSRMTARGDVAKDLEEDACSSGTPYGVGVAPRRISQGAAWCGLPSYSVGVGALDDPFYKQSTYTAFSFGQRGAKEKAWQKETRRIRGAPRPTPAQKGLFKKSPF